MTGLPLAMTVYEGQKTAQHKIENMDFAPKTWLNMSTQNFTDNTLVPGIVQFHVPRLALAKHVNKHDFMSLYDIDAHYRHFRRAIHSFCLNTVNHLI